MVRHSYYISIDCGGNGPFLTCLTRSLTTSSTRAEAV